MSGSIAGTIQGEAGSDPAAQFAVASTIFNRMKLGTFPGGSSPDAIVNAPSQFTGFSSSPNDTAQTFAQAIVDGTLPQYGDTGNAVNFQSGQTAINSGISAGTNIGGNFFSDNLGPPSSNFVAPSFGGSSDVSAADQAGGGGTIDFSIVPGSNQTLDLGGNPAVAPVDNGTAAGGVFDPTTGMGTGAFDAGSAVTGAAGDAAGAAAGAVTGAATGALGAVTGGLTGLAGIPDAIKTAGTTIAKGIGDQVANTFTAAENYAGRGVVILVAIVIFLAGIYLLVPREAKVAAARTVMA